MCNHRIVFSTMYSTHCIYQIAFIKLHLSYCLHNIGFITLDSSHCIHHNEFITLHSSVPFHQIELSVFIAFGAFKASNCIDHIAWHSSQKVPTFSFSNYVRLTASLGSPIGPDCGGLIET